MNITTSDRPGLATIQRINAIEPIADADAIEKARVRGWWVVVKKGQFRVGELVVYCEIDSLLPVRPEFEFLRKQCWSPARVEGGIQREGFRIRTVKFRGQVSQGICFPLEILPWITLAEKTVHEGDDVTKDLDIIQWFPPLDAEMESGRQAKGFFPSFLPAKTDEVRIQNCEWILEKYKGKFFYATEKLDGESFTAFLWGGRFGICTRNGEIRLDSETNPAARLARLLDLEKKLRGMSEKVGEELAVQGEMLGPGIRENRYHLQELDLYVFNVLRIAECRLMEWTPAQNLLRAFDLKPVPHLWHGHLGYERVVRPEGCEDYHWEEDRDFPHEWKAWTVDEIVEFVQQEFSGSRLRPMEGVVFRPWNEIWDDQLQGRLSFKVLNPDWLLKYGD